MTEKNRLTIFVDNSAGKSSDDFCGKLRWVDVGLQPYVEVLALQEQLVAQRQRGEGVDTLILCEHPPTYTLGVGASMDDVGVVGDVPVMRVGRGGGVTFHGPGQLVGYPILRLRDYGWRVSNYLCALERSLIATIRAVGIDAHCEGPTRGVYVEDRKLASIGIQVSRGIVWHGFALNVACDLAAFARITPCRQPDALMTSMAQELERPMTVSQVQRKFIERWDGLVAAPPHLVVSTPRGPVVGHPTALPRPGDFAPVPAGGHGGPPTNAAPRHICSPLAPSNSTREY